MAVGGVGYHDLRNQPIRRLTTARAGMALLIRKRANRSKV